MYSDDQPRWLIYRCLDSECGTLVYVAARDNAHPDSERVCLDCGGRAVLQDEPQPRSRWAREGY